MTGWPRFSSLLAWGLLCGGPSLALAQPAPVPMSLADCVRIALENNKTIQAAYLDRVVQKFDLRVAQDKFTPKMILSSGVERDIGRSNSGGTVATSGASAADVSASINQAVPTGARINLTTGQTASKADGQGRVTDHGWTLSLTQPLLKGGGLEVGRASVTAAQINEQVNIMTLKSVVTDTLASVITAYRTYLRSVKALVIARESVARARQLLQTNRELIAAGRMAEIDLVQSEADLANQEFNLLATENSTDAARLALVRLLDIDINTPVQPEDKFELQAQAYPLEEAKALALMNRPDYQSLRLGVETSRLRLMLAQNNRLPDLSFNAGYSRSNQSGSGVASGATAGSAATATPAGDARALSLGLRLSIPFGDLSFEQAEVSARIDLEKTELSLAKQRELIDIDVQNASRNVDMSLRQVRLAQRANELAQKKFAVESEKLKVGRSSNFQLVSFQNDLVNAQYNELGATINYLEAVTAMERAMGILLDRWGVSLARR